MATICNTLALSPANSTNIFQLIPEINLFPCLSFLSPCHSVGHTFPLPYLTQSITHSCGVLLKYAKQAWKQPVPKMFLTRSMVVLRNDIFLGAFPTNGTFFHNFSPR